MLEVTRIYRNASSTEIRVDTLMLTAKRDNICIGAQGRTSSGHVYERTVNTLNMVSTGSRTVAEIEIVGSFDSVETSSGDFLYVSWNSPSTILDMSDLPGIGDTV